MRDTSSSDANQAGCGCVGLPMFTLFVVFLVLKMTNTVDWSWWWVTCPLWIGPAIVICSGLLVAVIAIIIMTVIGIVMLVTERDFRASVLDWTRSTWAQVTKRWRK